MKSIYGYLTGAALGLFCVSTAYAQTTSTTYGTGTCTASSDPLYPLVGTMQAEIGGVLVPQAYGGAVFNQAECQCQSRDLGVHFVVTTGTGLGPAAPTAEMWIGEADCSEYSMRSTRVCDKVSATSLPNNTAWTINGTSFQTTGMFDVSIPPEVVTNPKPTMGYVCDSGGIANQTVSVLVGTAMAPAVCSMPVAVNTVGPTAPQDIAVASGDSGLLVSWDVPAGTGGIENYQVLCRKKSAPTQPAMSADFLNGTRYYFSSCINNHLFRRRPGDLMINSDPATTTDVPISTATFPIDPRLRCSDRVAPSGTSGQIRVTGLNNGEEYEVMVVSIDPYGNATGSKTVTATPQETAGPLADYCEGGTCPGFGCQAGASTRTTGGAATAALGLLGLGLVLLSRRARRVA